jgi:signal transduction histidine kinase
LAVDDTGPGIPENELTRVLDRFYRVPGTPSKGSGLGLAIVKQIAAAHQMELGLINTSQGLQACVIFAEVV